MAKQKKKKKQKQSEFRSADFNYSLDYLRRTVTWEMVCI